MGRLGAKISRLPLLFCEAVLSGENAEIRSSGLNQLVFRYSYTTARV
jgi:hypothetical protein